MKCKPKYEFVEDDVLEIEIPGSNQTTIVTRIRAIKTLKGRRKGFREPGTLGGYIENERNLSQIGNCWICEDSIVYGNVEILGDAKIFDSIITGIGKIRNSTYLNIDIQIPNLELPNELGLYYSDTNGEILYMDNNEIFDFDLKEYIKEYSIPI